MNGFRGLGIGAIKQGKAEAKGTDRLIVVTEGWKAEARILTYPSFVLLSDWAYLSLKLVRRWSFATCRNIVPSGIPRHRAACHRRLAERLGP